MPHGIPSVFPLQAIIGHTGEDPISMKKLLECEGTSEVEKEAFGWLINAIVWSIGGKCRNRQLPQNTMFILCLKEHSRSSMTRLEINVFMGINICCTVDSRQSKL